jgi:transglutaminase-like putative cysteine protease
MSPPTEPGQTTLENRIRIRPITWSHVYRDHWGTLVTAMESLAEHLRLDVEALSTVERTALPAPGKTPGWSALADDAVRDRSYEWLMLTPRTMPGPGVEELADGVRALPSPRAAAYRLSEQIREHVQYEHGVTGVHSNGELAWVERRGVCQDFAHITVGALRTLGIPARYVSGYLAPKRDSAVGETSSGESHAWVEFWDGAWLAMDPTNGTPVDVDHIVVARGRDYEDVSPFKGVYSGSGIATLEVSVKVTRLA